MNDFGSSICDGETRLPSTNGPWSPPELSTLSRSTGFDKLEQADLFAFGLLSLHILLPPEKLQDFGLWLLQHFGVPAIDWNMQTCLGKRLSVGNTHSDSSLPARACLSIGASDISSQTKSMLVKIVEMTLQPLNGERKMPWQDLCKSIGVDLSKG